MELNDKALQNPADWERAGFILPRFDREAVRRATKENPSWIHFGAGNIFRAYPAVLQQKLLDAGRVHTGIIVAEGYDYEIIDLANRPYDDLNVLVTLKADGSIEKLVVGSVVESLKMDSGDAAQFGRLREIFAAPSLQMVSFTITEKGYSLVRADGSFTPDVAQDFLAGPGAARSYMGKLTALLLHRWQNGAQPLTLVSMDNCSHNGTKLYEAVSAFATRWAEAGLVPPGFASWIENPDCVAFPWTMIDKITPRPDAGVRRMLEASGFTSTQGKITAKDTYIAPFVNAEETEYLVVEDRFPNARPPLEACGVLFTDRETVDKVEKMKVCTCLNPLHTAIAIFGCLLGYHKISDEMQDADLLQLAKRIGYQEGLPVVVDPGILSPKAFIDTVIELRLPNAFMPDTPQRIVVDTSQKLSVRYGQTIRAYQAREDLSLDSLVAIPLVLAAWCRYLMGLDDEGRSLTLEFDPMLPELCPHLAGLRLGRGQEVHSALQPILCNALIFGVDLYAAGLGARVEAYFSRMLEGPGAVRRTLREVLESAK